MKAIIAEKLKSNYILNLADIFEVIGDEYLNYNWLVSDIDTGASFIDFFKQQKNYIWASGEELKAAIEQDTSQFTWVVVSGFKKTVPLSEVLKFPLPFADGNRVLWSESVTIQNPFADIEIIAWDSTYAIVLSKVEKFIDDLKAVYPDAVDLLEYNVALNNL